MAPRAKITAVAQEIQDHETIIMCGSNVFLLLILLQEKKNHLEIFVVVS